MKIKHKILFFIPVVLVAGGIFWASHQTMPFVELKGIDFGDKILHAAAYFCFGAALLFGVAGYQHGSAIRKILIVTLTVGAIYAATDEIHQHFIPGRTMDFFDWLADFAGILLSLLLFRLMIKIVDKMVLKENKVEF